MIKRGRSISCRSNNGARFLTFGTVCPWPRSIVGWWLPQHFFFPTSESRSIPPACGKDGRQFPFSRNETETKLFQWRSYARPGQQMLWWGDWGLFGQRRWDGSSQQIIILGGKGLGAGVGWTKEAHSYFFFIFVLILLVFLLLFIPFDRSRTRRICKRTDSLQREREMEGMTDRLSVTKANLYNFLILLSPLPCGTRGICPTVLQL